LRDDERINPRPKKEQADKPANIDALGDVNSDEESPRTIDEDCEPLK
jgi:hypothetical protein